MVVVEQLEPTGAAAGPGGKVLADVGAVLDVAAFVDPDLNRDRIHLQAGRTRDAGRATCWVKADRGIALTGECARLAEGDGPGVGAVVPITAGVRHHRAGCLTQPPVRDGMVGQDARPVAGRCRGGCRG